MVPCGVLKKVDYFSKINMKKKAEVIENKELDMMLKDSFKKKLIQQIESKKSLLKKLS